MISNTFAAKRTLAKILPKRAFVPDTTLLPEHERPQTVQHTVRETKIPISLKAFSVAKHCQT